MICPKCGAEIENGRKCSYCGANITIDMLKEQELLKKSGCPKCSSTNITFNRENQGEIRLKNNKKTIHRTVGLCKDCGYTWNANEDSNKKNSKTWLWILGWICFFPIPLTVLIFRNDKIQTKVKYILIAVLWILILLIGIISGTTDTDTPSTTEAIKATETIATTEKVASVSITLVGGELGKYGREVELQNGIKKIEFKVPAGTYTVKNKSSAPWTQFNLYSEKIINGEQESPDGFRPLLINVGESATVEIPEGYLIYIIADDSVILEQ